MSTQQGGGQLPVLWPADVKSFADPCACPRENTRDTQPEPVQQESDIMLFPLSVCLPRDRRPEFGGALFSLCARRNPSAMLRKRTNRIPAQDFATFYFLILSFKASANLDRMRLPVASAPYAMSAVNFCQPLGASTLILAEKVRTTCLSWQVSVVECRMGNLFLFV